MSSALSFLVFPFPFPPPFGLRSVINSFFSTRLGWAAVKESMSITHPAAADWTYPSILTDIGIFAEMDRYFFTGGPGTRERKMQPPGCIVSDTSGKAGGLKMWAARSGWRHLIISRLSFEAEATRSSFPQRFWAGIQCLCFVDSATWNIKAAGFPPKNAAGMTK